MTTIDLETVLAGALAGRAKRVFGEVVTCKVTSEQTSGAFTLFEAVVRPGRSAPPHIHHREDECFYILEGTFEFSVEGRSHRAEAGSLLYIAKGTLQFYENIGSGTGRMLVWQTPGGLSEHFCEEVGEEPRSDETLTAEGSQLAVERTAKIAARYGIEFIGGHRPSTEKGPNV